MHDSTGKTAGTPLQEPLPALSVLPPPPAPPSTAKTRAASWSLRGIFCITLIFLLREAQPLLVPVAVAVLLTFVLATPVRFLRRHGVPEYIGAGILLVALLTGTALLGATLVGPGAQWWERAPETVNALARHWDRLRAAVPGLAPALAPRSAAASARQPAKTPPPDDPVKEKIVSEGVTMTGFLIGRLASFGLSATATVILLYFLLSSEHWLLSRTLEAIPRRRTRALVLSAVRTAQREIGLFLGALSVINFGVGIATALVMSWIGLPNPVLWASVAAILNFIPYIGPILITCALGLAGLVSFADEPGLILAPAIGFLALHAIESNLISPWFIGRRLALSRLAVFLSVMFWGWIWGIAGAMIAVPVLIGIRSLCKRKRSLRSLCVYLDESGAAPPSLGLLLQRSEAAGAVRRRRPQVNTDR